MLKVDALTANQITNLLAYTKLTELVVRQLFYIETDSFLNFITEMKSLQCITIAWTLQLPYSNVGLKINKSTYLKLCKICGERNQKLKIFNSETDDNQLERFVYTNDKENVYRDFVQFFYDIRLELTEVNSL